MADADIVDDFFRQHPDVETVILCGTDLIGKQRGKRVSTDHFRASARHGIHLASFVQSAGLLDEPLPGILEDGVPDIIGRPDLATLRLAGWEARTAIVFFDWLDGRGEPHPLCLRSELRRQEAALVQTGARVRAAIELEFYLARRDGLDDGFGCRDEDGLPDAIHCYGILEGARDEAVLGKLRAALPDVVEGVTTEWGYGQREATLAPDTAVGAADRAILLKLAVKSIAAREGYRATFMAKWRSDRSGSSAHVHLSLVGEDGALLFHDATAEHRLSSTLGAWVGGQVDLFRAATMFHAPFVNSYRRFRADSFAPLSATVGIDNRTVAFRIVARTPESTRVEHRVPGADANPYASLSAILATGRHGLARRSELPSLTLGNAYRLQDRTLPSELAEAVSEATGSAALANVFPQAITLGLGRLLLHEAQLASTEVPDTEVQRYFATV